jgi:hypothetical protein
MTVRHPVTACSGWDGNAAPTATATAKIIAT